MVFGQRKSILNTKLSDVRSFPPILMPSQPHIEIIYFHMSQQLVSKPSQSPSTIFSLSEDLLLAQPPETSKLNKPTDHDPIVKSSQVVPKTYVKTRRMSFKVRTILNQENGEQRSAKSLVTAQ